ncbi:hypothetical protein MBANPS3_010868 [Mucor bainieri]
MGVQDVVARLNKSKSANASKPTSTIPPVPKRKMVMTVDDKRLPPSPAMSPTSTINSTSTSKRDDHTPTASGIASMMQRFEQTSPLTTTKLPSPPESPSQQQNKLNVTQKPRDAHALFKFDATASEMVDLFQTLLDQNAAAEEYIKTLKQDVEKYASDATKVRDYEIRVEYLALKLEQVSEERDYFEKELNELAHKQKQQQQQQQNTAIMSSPMSPAFSQIDQRDIVIEDEQKLQSQNNDAYMADLLNVYEEISDQDDHEGGGDDMQLFDEQSASQIQSQQEEIEILNDKLIECDRGVQITLMKLEAKALKQVVKKQDELITKLETKIKETPAESPDELLKEQVEVQRVELENKRELLAQLLNEREDLLRRLNSNQRNSLLRRSSIELLTNIINNNRPASFSSVASSSGRGTPPLTAPPKQPLPPLPSPTSSSTA